MLSLAVFVPLAGAVVALALRRAPEATQRWVATAVAAVPLVLLLAAWARFDGTGGFELVEQAAWIPSLGVAYKVGIDGISLVLAIMSALLFAASAAYPVDLKGRAHEYFAWLLFLEFASLGVFVALDLFLFYVFFDLTLVGMYFLIAVWGHGDAKRAALKFFLYTLTGTLVMLLAILGLVLSTDPLTFDIPTLIATNPLAGEGLRATLVFLGFAFGLGVKTPLVPVHTWLPPAHVDAPAPASTILAGVLLKLGTYAYIRILLQIMPDTFARFALPVAIVAVVSIVYGALVAMGQDHLKRRIAYTSVNHMGYAILGIAVAAAATGAGHADAQRLALTGAVVEMVAHGLITGALFLVSGSIYARARDYDLASFGGLAERSPRLAGATILAAFASLGLPGLAGFVAEFQIFAGTFAVYPWLAAIGLVGVVVTAALFLQMLQRLFFGELPPRWEGWRDLVGVETAVLVVILAPVVAIGVLPKWLLDPIETATRLIVGG
ncbi:MAG: complex I subunit 4 family protein [Candidatus Longimicrobiales bacterium M2_2A_002]|jgi:NADH-quinone oxidoreductase subunit M